MTFEVPEPTDCTNRATVEQRSTPATEPILIPRTSRSSLPHRLASALLLRMAPYGQLKSEPQLWPESVVIVGVVAVSHGVGAILRSPSQGYTEPVLLTFLFGFVGEILLWLGTSASIHLGAHVLSRQPGSFGDVARPLGFAAAPGVGVVVAGALSGTGRSAVPILVVMAIWRVAASFVAVRSALGAGRGAAVGWLLLGLIGGIALMGGGTALLNAIAANGRGT